MIEKKTILDQIEIRASGIVQVRLLKQIVEDGRVLMQESHRTSIEPGCDVDAQMAIVNLHLQAMGCATVENYQQLKDHVALAHTEEVVAAFKAAQEKKE